MQEQEHTITRFIVDPIKGPFKTIEKAVEACPPGGVVKIVGGVYSTEYPIVINKPIRIEPKEREGEVYLHGVIGPVLVIDLESPDDICVINDIKIGISGYPAGRFRQQMTVLGNPEF